MDIKYILFANSLFNKTSPSVISNYDSAIFFIGTSKADLAYEIMERMMERGFLVNLSIFPAVSQNHSGIRFIITVLQTYEQIESMIATLNEEFMAALQRNNFSIEQINDAFRVVAGFDRRSTGTFLN